MTQEDDLLMLACQKLTATSSESPQMDEFDSFGQTVANDAKKHISDGFFYEGQLGILSRDSTVLTVPDRHDNS